MKLRIARYTLSGLILLLGLAACNSPGTVPGTGMDEPDEAQEVEDVSLDPTAEPIADVVVLSRDTCLTSGGGETSYVNEAGGYCLLIPADFSISEDRGLDIFVVGPTLATFGMHALVLAFDFSVIGAPGGAGVLDAQGWGGQVVADNGTPDFPVSIEPYTVSGPGLDGVRVGPLPGLSGGEAIIVRANDTLYSITIYPDAQSSSEYSAQIETMWSQLSSSMRFFTPVQTDVDYQTEGEVCPAEEPGKRAIISLVDGWCALLPTDWEQDSDFHFPGRFVGGPRIGEFWPGQPPFANVVIGYSGPALDSTLEQQVEFRKIANGRPDLVSRTDTSIGSYPAVILDTQDGPIPEMVAMIHANGNMYTVLGTPFDEVDFPEAQESLRAAWDMVIQTIQFFEPYR